MYNETVTWLTMIAKTTLTILIYQYPFLGLIENLISKKIKYTRKNKQYNRRT